MSKQYEYLIAYQFQNGCGRAFVTLNAPIKNASTVEAVEKWLMDQEGNDHVGRITVNNFQLLREWSE